MGDAATRSSKLPRALFAVVTSAIVVVVLGVLLHTPRFDPLRTPANPLKTVTIGLYGIHGRPLHSAELMQPTDSISVTFDNPRLEGTQLVLFAVDANGAAHWFVPLDRAGHRESMSRGLPTTQGERGLLGQTPLGDLPPGPLTFVALINPGVIQLDRIDAFTPEERTPEGLRERFPDAVVLTWPVVLAGPPPAPPAPIAPPTAR